MLNIIIPFYNGRDTLPDLLHSLCCQTKKNFIVTVVSDQSPEDCQDIIKEFKKYLHIRYTETDRNGGPGYARQTGLNLNYNSVPMCDYVMFCDDDDLLMPRAVDVLYTGAKKTGADIVKGQFITECENQDMIIYPIARTTTWVHGRIYRTQYLKDNDIGFLPELRLNEDAYFNLAACLLTENIYEIEEPLAVWRNNQNSVTRSDENFTYNNNFGYMYSQIRGFEKILSSKFDYKLGPTMLNIYNSYELLCLKEPEKIEEANCLIYELFTIPRTYELFQEPHFAYSLTKSEGGRAIGQDLIFYPHSFNSWCGFFGIKLGIK